MNDDDRLPRDYTLTLTTPRDKAGAAPLAVTVTFEPDVLSEEIRGMLKEMPYYLVAKNGVSTVALASTPLQARMLAAAMIEWAERWPASRVVERTKE